MATPHERAIALKNEGNKAFSAHDWPKAIELYTQAIELDDKQPTFYANRAQVCHISTGLEHSPCLLSSQLSARVTDTSSNLQAYLKTEAYGYAISDATKAIELDPSFVKVRTFTHSPPLPQAVAALWN